MKSIKYFVLLLAVVFLFPFVAFAEEEEETAAAEEDTRAIVYFFHGETCPHCQEAREWFESIQDEYGEKFKLVEYEVWNNEENNELMQKVSELRYDNATGVPYIICGDQSWIGFDEASMAEEITSKIDEVYNTPVEERYDILKLVSEIGDESSDKKPNDVVALILILVVAGGLGFGIYQARKTTN